MWGFRHLVPLAALLVAAAPASASPLHVTGSVAIPDGGWDYASIDPANHRLYVARSESVTVVDLSNSSVHSIGAIARGHAVVPLPGGKRVLVTSGNDSTVRIIDVADGRQVASFAVGKRPDAAIYDPRSGRVLIMNAGDGSVAVIDPVAMKVEKTIAVKAGLEAAALGNRSELFVNDEDANEIEVVDLAKGVAGPPIALPGCEGPSGLGYDAKHDRLISVCANGKAAIVDAGHRRLIGLVDIGRGPDTVIIDAARRLAFVPCGRDGVLDVLALDRAGGVKSLGPVTTEPGARTGALDPATGTIYLPTARLNPAASGTRPTMVPGSAHILMVR